MTHRNTRLALPKGRMQEALFRLLADAGMDCHAAIRSYRLDSLPGFACKILKPRSIVEMLHVGTRDAGFAGADWVEELGADVVEVLDLGLDPVRIAAAAPEAILVDGRLPDSVGHAGPLRVATEYEQLTQAWLASRGLAARVVHSFGATEVYPPEDADFIVDNIATGSTLRANQLVVVDELMTSTTRFYANPRALEDAEHRDRIEALATLMRSVLTARERVLLEINVPATALESVIEALPCMRQPTVSRLYDEEWFSVRAAVPRVDLPTLIPSIKRRGGVDLLISNLTQIVP